MDVSVYLKKKSDFDYGSKIWKIGGVGGFPEIFEENIKRN